MTLSKNLTALLAAPDQKTFESDLQLAFTKDAAERNPDVTNAKMLGQLARPKYLEAVKELNTEIESLKIVNRRKA